MKTGEASGTAEFNALFRAIESSRRVPLFEDGLAKGFLRRLKAAYLFSRLPLIGKLIPLYIDLLWPGVRPSSVGRTCMIDELLLEALADGARQMVILGAGYDSRSYRIGAARGLRSFEVDHPATLHEKKKRLERLIGPVPECVKLVGVDFDTGNFADALTDLGFDRSVMTFFIWEGVMHYLTGEAVDRTLRSIRALSAPGSRLVFTYIHRGLLDGTADFGNRGRVDASLMKSGEPWKFGIHPDGIRGFLLERGFSLLSDTGSREYRSRYVGNSRRVLRGFEFYRLACARPLDGRDAGDRPGSIREIS